MYKLLFFVFAATVAYVVAGGDRKATEFFANAFHASAAKIIQVR